MYLLEIKSMPEIVCFSFDLQLEEDTFEFGFSPYGERFYESFPADSVCQSVEADYYDDEDYAEASCSEHGTYVLVAGFTGKIDISVRRSDIVRYLIVESIHYVTLTDEALACVRGLVKACQDAMGGETEPEESR